MSIVKANKYQTLAGATMPVPIQMVYSSTYLNVESSSTSWVDVSPVLSITPKFANSILDCEYECNLWVNGNTGQGGVVGSWWWSNDGGSTYNNFTTSSLVTFHNGNQQDARTTRIRTLYNFNTTSTIYIKYRMAMLTSYSSGMIIIGWPNSANGQIPTGGTKPLFTITELGQ